jgi:PadR family transcriptional regulator, regulatory protein PadR
MWLPYPNPFLGRLCCRTPADTAPEPRPGGRRGSTGRVTACKLPGQRKTNPSTTEQGIPLTAPCARRSSARIDQRLRETRLPLEAELLRDPLDNSCASSYIGRMPTVDNQRQRLEFLQGTLEVLILRSLRAAPNHAYGISQFLHQQSENEFLVDNGSLYPALQRLLQRRLIAAQWRRSPNGRRAKYYRLTPLGRKQLVAASSKWLRFVEAMGRILAPEG